MTIHQFTLEEVFHSLHSGPSGLAEAEATRRLREFGPNRVQQVAGPSLVRRLLQGFTHFFALILWVAAGLAFYAEWWEPGQGMATLGFAILGVIVLNGLFSFWQEFRAERAMAVLQRLLPRQVKVQRDGSVRQLPAEDVVPGDLILLDDGDDIPADCRLLEAFGVRVNNATVTGESAPQARDTRPSTEQDLLHSRNILLAGTSLVSGQARAVVIATGMHTEFGKIAHLTQHRRADLSPLQQEIQRLSRFVAALALGLGLFFFLIGQWLGLPFWSNFLFAIGIIVANVPEGLLPTVTLALALGSQRMARKNALIRHLPSVETLGSATVICTDKTGTLTLNRMTVKRLFLAGQFHDALPDQMCRLGPAHPTLFQAAYHCHTLKEVNNGGGPTLLGDPMEIALVRLAQQALPEELTFPRVDEVPFDADRKRLSTLHRTPEGLILYTKGALETVLPLCLGDARREYLQAQDTLAAAGLRVLAIAYRKVPEDYRPEHLEEGLTLLGLVALEDPPRPEVPDAIHRCQTAGIKVIMATGDHPHTAVAVARQVGLLTDDMPTVITGDQLRRMSPIQLQLALDRPGVLFARVGADQKMHLVRALKAKGHVVAMTGDGVNDAPALRQADIGIAMGQSGTDVAREAADMVLLDDNFATIVAAVEEGRAVFANIRRFLTYILTSNVPELVPYLAFVLFRIPLALTILQILVVDLGTDIVPALGLGAEPPHPETMRQPPRRRTQRVLDWPLLARSYLFLGLWEALAGMAAFFFVLTRGGWEYGQLLSLHAPLYLQATTACLAAIIVMQMANVFLCRSEDASLFTASFFSNGLIWCGILTEMAILGFIAYTPWGNQLFETAPLDGMVWLFLIPFLAGMVGLEELRKYVVRARQPSGQ